MGTSETAHLLLVEDDFEIRDALSDLLSDEGFKVIQLEDGLKALDYLRSAKGLPNLILLDISMPSMDGYTFRAEQIKDVRLAKIPTIMISANGNFEKKAAIAGVTETIRKPIELEELFSTVRKYYHLDQQ